MNTFMKNKLWQLMILSTSLMISCGEESKFTSELDNAKHIEPIVFDFLTFESGYNGAMPAVKNEELVICLSGTTSSNQAKFEDWIIDSLEKWLAPLQQISASPIAKPKVVSPSDGIFCNIDFEIVSGQWGYTMLTYPPQVVVGPNVPYGVVFHEFGHVLGLRDTYQNGQSGNCQAGQPQSLMCNISFTELQPDDIAGIQKVFENTFPDEPKPDDLPEPTDELELDTYLAIEEPESNLEYINLHFAVHDESLEKSELRYCIRGIGWHSDPCETGEGWKKASINTQNEQQEIKRFIASARMQYGALVEVQTEYRVENFYAKKSFILDMKKSEVQDATN